MKRWLARQRHWLSFGGGLTLGLLVGVGLLIGGLVGSRYGSPSNLPVTQLHASATHGGETFAIATGPITGEVEGVFFLDFLTGELQCRVINVRLGQLAALYRHNVITDLGLEKGKTPKFLIATGGASFRSGGGGTQLANCVVYVADSTSGNWAAYALPWNRQAESVGVAQAFPFQLIGTGKARELTIRDQ